MHDIAAIEALTFDADQTLWDFHGVHRKALDATVATMIRRGDVRSGGVTAEQLQAARTQVVERYRGQPHNLEEVREQSFAVFLESVGHTDPSQAASELVDIFMQVRFDAIQLYPEVRTSLGRLRARFKIGLLSNGNTYPERCGLPDTFDAVVLGPGYGFEKPDPRAFRTVSDLLGVPVNATAHVGDDWDDIRGANAVGAMSIFMNRDGSDPDFRSEADHEITNLVDLETLLTV